MDIESASREFFHLSHWERSDRIARCDPGLRSIDRPYPLTPTLSHRSRIYPTSTIYDAQLGPSWVGEGAHFRCGGIQHKILKTVLHWGLDHHDRSPPFR